MTMDFGFTDDEAQYRKVKAWRDAATADGWSIEPTYAPQGKSKGEPVESAASLHRDGWVARILTRDNQDKPGKRWKYEAKVSVWTPEGRGVAPGATYSWERLQRDSLRCDKCGKLADRVHNVGFANKGCADCLPAMRKAMEYPGWAD